MSIAIMQPYVFPYIGYFQLIHATDTFVFYDDVNYINKGWINRNRILLNNKDQLFTIPCKEASQNKLIKDIEVLQDAKAINKIFLTLQGAYKKAPYYNEVYPLIAQIITLSDNLTISQMAIKSVKDICSYLGMERKFIISSDKYTNQELKKADRLIDICHLEGIADYTNAAGGKEIYTKEYFIDSNVNLSFLVPERCEYTQFGGTFVPWLSIIDILMFNSKEEVNNKILPSYHRE